MSMPCVCTGVLENTAEMKLSQLRLAALDTLLAFLSASQVTRWLMD